MRVLLTNPPWVTDERRGVVAGSRWSHSITGYKPFPFFLAYAAAVLEEGGHEVMAIDAVASDLDDESFIREVRRFSPEVTVMETSTPSIKSNLVVAERVKEETECRLVLCGPHVSALPEEALRNEFVDFVAIGEYEFTLLELVEALEERRDPRVRGIAFRTREGVTVTERRPPVDPLDRLPFPARHLFPMHAYHELFCQHRPNLQMLTSRGCPYRCIFCLWPSTIYFGRKHRPHSPGRVVNEMEHVIEEYNPREIYFDDDTATLPRDRILEICALIRERGISAKWSMMGHVMTVDREMLGEMAAAGCIGIKFGVESADPEILRRSKKYLKLEKVKRVVGWCKELGIKSHLTFLLGLPGESVDSIKKTINFALSVDPDSVQFSIAVPFPGTEFYALAKKEGWLISEDWSNYDGARCSVVSYPTLSSRAIEDAYRLAVRSWMFKKALGRGEGFRMLASVVRDGGLLGAIKRVALTIPYFLRYLKLQ